ncbi:DUF6286 domain-containing protein [Nonomuraea candida]|uniref:DUF6286 domain-containing protein n=1 Tax=Nonomuraea candida TaxID=359159 RepID=UPI000A93AD7D|nr:DUF6286 domain-containing protein [Nonomuraea candida]
MSTQDMRDQDSRDQDLRDTMPVPGGAHRAPVEPPRSKAADRAAVRAFRPQRRVPAIVAALLLTLLSLLVLAETVSALAGRPLRWLPYDRMLAWASSTLWSDPRVLLGSALVTLLGLAALALALVPGRPRMVPVRSGDPDVIIGLRPKSVTRALARAAEQVPGVRSARVRLRGHTFAVTPDTSERETDGVGRDVRGAVLSRLAGLDPVRPYRVAVNLKERR